MFYTSRLISEQAPKGKMDDWKYNITEVFFVAILEKELEVSKEYFHDICLCNRKTGKIFYDGLGYTFIELSNFVKISDELESDLDRWLYSLKHLSEMDNLPPDLRKPIFEKLYNIAEYTNMTKEEQDIYDEQRKRKWDNAAVKEQERIDLEERAEQIRTEALHQGVTEGKIEGLTEGKIEGRIEERKSMALKMKQDGFSIDIIMKYTTLSTKEINAL